VLACAALVLALDNAAAQTPTVPTSLTLEAALARAEAVNPAIVAARARRATGVAEIAVARERLNPERVSSSNERHRHRPTAFSLPLELGGKRARRIAVSTAAAAHDRR
jgi:hypothetical protein